MADRLDIGRLPAGVLGAAFVVLWSTGYPAARIALDHAAPFTVLVLRFGCAGLIYAALAQWGRASWPRGRAALHSAVVGTLQLALQFGCLYFAAAQGVNVGLIALIIGTMPIVTALAGLVLGEGVRPLQWFGLACGFAGVALAVGEGIGPGHGGGAGAYLAVVGGLLALSAGTLYQKRFGSDVDLRSGLAVQNVVGTLLLLPFALHEGWRVDASAELLGSLTWMVAVNSLAAFALFFVLLRRGAVNRVTTLFFLMPPVTALIDHLVLGDPFSVQKVAGISVAALGVYLATRPAPSRHARAAGPRPAAALTVSAPRLATPRSCPTPCR
ncbi:MAG TPA: DMT family transporter [Steroidobacteraceae bacterium]|nr:DMT family transporter [Steroidobacteraceae bacterium]